MFLTRRAYARAVTLAVNNVKAKHTLPELPYAYEALEPVISRDIMMLHHQKHHQTYVTNLNATEEKMQAAVSQGDASAAISLLPALRFNGGGHLNHAIFWKNLSPDSTQASASLCTAINEAFGGMDQMKQLMAAAAIGVMGSGWAWLGVHKPTRQLRIITCSNQDPLEGTTGLIPIFGIDVWEHAYYLQYKNVRADYVKAIFDVVNWKDLSERFEKASC